MSNIMQYQVYICTLKYIIQIKVPCIVLKHFMFIFIQDKKNIKKTVKISYNKCQNKSVFKKRTTRKRTQHDADLKYV